MTIDEKAAAFDLIASGRVSGMSQFYARFVDMQRKANNDQSAILRGMAELACEEAMDIVLENRGFRPDPATMHKDEKSLLLYIESCCVDNAGLYDPERMNETDRVILKRWTKERFVSHGRVFSGHLTARRAVWFKMSTAAFQVAHELRMARADRMWDNREWKSTEELKDLV